MPLKDYCSIFCGAAGQARDEQLANLGVRRLLVAYHAMERVHAEQPEATSRDEEGAMEYLGLGGGSLGLGGGGSLGLGGGGSLGLARRGVDVAAKLFSTDGFCAVSA